MRTIRIFWDEDAMMFYVEFVERARSSAHRDRLANLCLPVDWHLLPYWVRSWIANGELPVISNGPKIAQDEQSNAATPPAIHKVSKPLPEEWVNEAGVEYLIIDTPEKQRACEPKLPTDEVLRGMINLTTPLWDKVDKDSHFFNPEYTY